MKTQDELWAEYERLFDAEEYEEAGKILEMIPPISDEEWFRKLRDAPLDDEPVTADDRRALDEAHAALDRIYGRRTG